MINNITESKLWRTDHYVVCTAGTDNNDVNSDNILFTIKELKLCVPVVTLSIKDNRKLSKHFQQRMQKMFLRQKNCEWKYNK